MQYFYIKMVKNLSFQQTLKEVIRNVANIEINRNQFTDLYVVNKLNTYEDNDPKIELTCNIVQMDGIQSFNNVKWISQGLGNGKGFIMPPRIGDVVVVIFYGQTNIPLIIGNIFNTFMQGNRFENINGVLTRTDSNRNDDLLDVAGDEWILIAKLNGCYIYGNKDNVIKIANANGNLKLNANGTIMINDAFTFPLIDGSSGQVLKTNGSGVLTWENDNT